MARHIVPTLLLTGALGLQALAWAGKPEWAGNPGKHQPQERAPAAAQPAPQVSIGNYFQEAQRQAVSSYYGKQQAAGHCPPGLAKKNNGCLPPGQAKQWQRGQVLPATVVRYPVPPEVLRRIGNPPPGYQFIRVANDILLIAVGSQMVVDAIEDLMR